VLKRILLPIIIIAISIAGFIGLKNSKPEKPVLEKLEKVWHVDTIPVVFQSLSPQITVYGRVETPKTSSLTSALESDVIQVNVLEGSEVNKGDVLVELDVTDADLLIAQRKADLAEIEGMIDAEFQRYKRDQGLLASQQKLLKLADAEVTRLSKLADSGLASKSSYDSALTTQQQQLLSLKNLQYDIASHPARLAQLKAKQRRAEALVEQAEVDKKRCVIKAPFTGRVSRLNVSVGDRVMTGNSIIAMYDLSALEVRAQLPGRYISQIRMMMANHTDIIAKANIDGHAMRFSLARFSGEVQQDSGGIDGLFKVIDDNYPLALGTFVPLTMELSAQQDVIEIPYNALYELNHVYIIENGYLKQVAVEQAGELTNSMGEKRLLVRSSALTENDVIVTTQLPNAITGLRVEAVSD
jgi:biotin carboxyl carrier protein